MAIGYVDMDVEYYRFVEDDVSEESLGKCVLLDTVPDWVYEAYQDGYLQLGRQSIGINPEYGLYIEESEDELPDTANIGDYIIKPIVPYANQDEICIVPQKVFNKLFRFDRGE